MQPTQHKAAHHPHNTTPTITEDKEVGEEEGAEAAEDEAATDRQQGS